jgi:hypothetical protein
VFEKVENSRTQNEEIKSRYQIPTGKKAGMRV